MFKKKKKILKIFKVSFIVFRRFFFFFFSHNPFLQLGAANYEVNSFPCSFVVAVMTNICFL